jgi:hypothetical protein
MQLEKQSYYISTTTMDGVNPIFVLQGSKLYVTFGKEVVEMTLDSGYGFPIPAIAFVNCYLGSTHIVQQNVLH